MIYNTLTTYPYTADYYKTENTATSQELPNWVDTYISTININIGSANNYAKLTIYSNTALGIGYILKNIRDANGDVIIQPQENLLGLDTTSYRINACDPRMNLFGFNEGYIISAVQLNPLRAI